MVSDNTLSYRVLRDLVLAADGARGERPWQNIR
jgi:hypothetical protein